ncbi:hypothetical protein BaRGS_00031148 [Batillaria attramentaria]|uniref:Hexosyltransferase n=1 Tax=Batillaria attramentaria TaxID=370345 RepID=A0ABD0JSD6_9CAEN
MLTWCTIGDSQKIIATTDTGRYVSGHNVRKSLTKDVIQNLTIQGQAMSKVKAENRFGVDDSNRRVKLRDTGKESLTDSVTPRPKRCNRCFNSDFPFLIDEPHLCSTQKDQTVEIIFLIVTSFKARMRRDAVRQTWASITQNNTSSYRHVFLFGTTPDGAVMKRVREESRQFRDVLVSDFLDSYRNLTLKTLMGLRWAATRCRHAKFFMKVDDDVWVNTANLKAALARKGKALQQNLGGMCRTWTTVIRDPKSKWYVSREYFPYEYPSYCVGFAYVGGLGVAEGIAAVSQDTPFFFMEDVYVGFCLEAAGLGIAPIGGFHHNIAHVLMNGTCEAKTMKLIAAHPVYVPRMRMFWGCVQ